MNRECGDSTLIRTSFSWPSSPGKGINRLFGERDGEVFCVREFQMHQELAVSFCSKNRRFNQIGRAESNLNRRLLDFHYHPSVLSAVSYDTAASDFSLPDFKLRFDQ